MYVEINPRMASPANKMKWTCDFNPKNDFGWVERLNRATDIPITPEQYKGSFDYFIQNCARTFISKNSRDKPSLLVTFIHGSGVHVVVNTPREYDSGEIAFGSISFFSTTMGKIDNLRKKCNLPQTTFFDLEDFRDWRNRQIQQRN